MVELYGGAGVAVEVDVFVREELEARRILHATVDAGSDGTEPDLWSAYFRDLFSRCGVPEDAFAEVSEAVRRAHEERHMWTHTIPGTGAVLDRLRKDGLRVGVISNADGRMEGALVDAGLRDHLEFVIDSGTVGVAKPSAEIFLAGCEAAATPAAECLYVGDLYPVDYVGASNAGLRALLLDPLGVHGERADTVSELAEVGAWVARG